LPLTEVELISRRSQAGYVPQEIVLFPGTVLASVSIAGACR
jgi:ABC-type bacteriocin/lantibiotic exporter with double-glycine peptidase domain